MELQVQSSETLDKETVDIPDIEIRDDLRSADAFNEFQEDSRPEMSPYMQKHANSIRNEEQAALFNLQDRPIT